MTKLITDRAYVRVPPSLFDGSLLALEQNLGGWVWVAKKRERVHTIVVLNLWWQIKLITQLSCAKLRMSGGTIVTGTSFLSRSFSDGSG